jgi:hypothetical protein
MPIDEVTDITVEKVKAESDAAKDELDLMKQLGFSIVRLPVI